jgi:hypothetical protein
MNIAKELHDMAEKIGGNLQPPRMTIDVESVYVGSFERVQLRTHVTIYLELPNGSDISVDIAKPYGQNVISEAIEEAWGKVNEYCEQQELCSLRQKLGEIHRLSACPA